jgi:predicted AAA+ superfamily ATPase
MEIQRKYYLNKINTVKNTDYIKIITGIRRCGKSTILKQYVSVLSKKVNSNQILFIDFDDMKNKSILNVDALEKYIYKNLSKNKKNYIFLDEIQNVENFESLILSLYQDKNNDIYLTGSNSHMLSKQIATKFTGRDLQIQIFPFSFSEFSEYFIGKIEPKNMLDYYKRLGGLPGILAFYQNQDFKEVSINGIIESILNRDLIPHFKIKNVPLLRKLFEFALDNIGKEFSPNNIANFLQSNKLVKIVSTKTIDNYLSYLADGFLLHKSTRYNIKGKMILKTLYKYYAIDLGIRNVYLSKSHLQDTGKQLENIVCLELLRRYTKVNTGMYQYTDIKNKTTLTNEVDFICRNNSEVVYIQVCEDISKEDVLQRELFILRKINNGKKLLLNNNGINTVIDGIDIVDVTK